MLSSLGFQDPFNTSFPKGIEREIQDVACVTATLSKCGHFFAAGCNDSSIVIYDLQVYSRVCELYDETLKGLTLQKLKFNDDSSLLACGLGNNEIVIWGCAMGNVVFKYSLRKSPIIVFEFDVNGRLLVAHENGSIAVKDVKSDDCQNFSFDGSIADMCCNEAFIFVLFTDSKLIVLDRNNSAIVCQYTESSLGAADHNGFSAISCNKSGNELILVGKNRSLRVILVDPVQQTISLKFKLQNAVDKYNLKCAGFSHHSNFDASFTFAGASTKGRHLIYIWENSTSNLVQTLEGPKEEVGQIYWSPVKPQLYSIGLVTGKIYIWSPLFPQKWAALVPNIEAIETNIEYIEKENEFDLSVEDEILAERDADEMIELDLNSFKPQKGNKILTTNTTRLFSL